MITNVALISKNTKTLFTQWDGVSWLLFFTGLAMPISTAISSGLFGVLLIVALYQLRKDDWLSALREPVVYIPLLLFSWLALSILWSEAEIKTALSILKKYRELIFFSFLIPLMVRNKSHAIATLFGYLVAMFVIFSLFIMVELVSGFVKLLPDLITLFSDVLRISNPQFNKGALFKDSITTSLMMALSGFLLISWGKQKKEKLGRVLMALGGAMLLFNLFISQGRTGQLITLFLVVYLFVIWLGWRGFWLSGLLIFLLVVTSYSISPTFKNRYDQVVNNIEQYENNINTSVGLRVAFHEDAVPIIMEQPWVGHGVGSVYTMYKKMAKNQYLQFTKNPHSEYLAMLIQGGGVAFLFFLWMLISHGLVWKKEINTDIWAISLQGVVLAYAIGSLANSFILDSAEGHLYVLLVSSLWCLNYNKFKQNSNKYIDE